MKRINAYNRGDFRKWLVKNHKKESKVAVLIHKKHTGKSSPSHREMIEEAICFGWIDTTIKRLDDDTYIRHFSKRTEKSRWSNNTIGYAKQLIREGKMSPEGLKFYKLGLAKPTHDHGIPRNPDMPTELSKALLKNKIAARNFEVFSPSVKRTFYRWLLRAKQPETVKKRIDQIIQATLRKDNNVFNPTQKENI